MANESGSTADVPLDANGSSASHALLPNAVEQSLIEALYSLVQQMAETNQHLLTMTHQMAMMLEHLASQAEDDAEEPSMYLDGSPLV